MLIHEGSEIAPRDGGPQELAIASVGTFAEIREASRYADGRWELLTVGGGRFVIETVRTGVEPYLVAEVEPLDDALGDADTAEVLMRRVSRRFVEYLRLLQPREGEAATAIDVQVEVEVPDAGESPRRGRARGPARGRRRPRVPRQAAGGDVEGDADEDDGPALASVLRIPDDPSHLSFLLTGILQVEPSRKQALLEATTAEQRLRELDRVLDRELQLLRARLGALSPGPPRPRPAGELSTSAGELRNRKAVRRG